MNAALSFAYTLLLARARVAVSRAGLHPALGVLHVSHGRRAALALDLMEPFRAAVADTLTVGLLRSGRLPLDGFTDSATEGVRVGREGCAVIAEAFASRAAAWNLDAALLAQVRAVQAGLTGGPCAVWKPPTRP